MSRDGYHQFCPVAKACESLEPRWTLLILCEMWSGSRRFNEIKRGVPGMSPTLLSKRLKEMEVRGLISRRKSEPKGTIEYLSTNIGLELEPIVHALGQWAHRNIDAEITLESLDARLLMWNIRRKIDTQRLPASKTVIQFIYPELDPDQQSYWLIADPGSAVDLCLIDPGLDVNLLITADLKAMTSAWIGLSRLDAEIADKKIILAGDPKLAGSIRGWMVRSSFAKD